MSTGTDIVKEGADVAAVTVTIGALAEFLPPIAALFAILWTAIRVYEYARVVIFKKPPRETPK